MIFLCQRAFFIKYIIFCKCSAYIFYCLINSDKQDCILNKNFINTDKKGFDYYYSVDNYKNEHFKKKQNKWNKKKIL